MISAKLDPVSAQRTVRELRAFDKNVQNKAWNLMYFAGQKIRQEAIGKAPVGITSGLRNGMKVDWDKAKLEVSVWNAWEYAPFVEFGTGTKVSVPDGYEAFAMQFYRGPGHNQRAQPFLIPPYERYTEKLVKDIDTMIEKETR
jgi:hypothetical protein